MWRSVYTWSLDTVIRCMSDYLFLSMRGTSSQLDYKTKLGEGEREA